MIGSDELGVNSSLNVMSLEDDQGPDEGRGEFGDEKALWALKQIKEAKPTIDKHRKQARECNDFVAGRHFTTADMEAMRIDGRPTAIFNAAQKWIRYISGMERLAKYEVQFMPRDPHNEEQGESSDIAGAFYEYAIQQCNGDDERSVAFNDMLRTGMGWTDVMITRETHPDGMVVLNRVPGEEMLWDVRARKNCLEDTRWRARERQVSRMEALQRWGKEHRAVILANVGKSSDMSKPETATLFSEKEAVPVDSSEWPNIGKNSVKVIEFQWYDEVANAVFLDPLNDGKLTTMPMTVFEEYRRRYKKVLPGLLMTNPEMDLAPEIEYEEVIGRKYQRMIIIGRSIVAGPFDMPGNRFSFNCITGQWDDEEGYFYGFMRYLIDPQKYMTKFANQMLEIITRSAKGGLICEEDTFPSVMEAEQTWAKTGGITVVRAGMIDKLKDKPQPAIPQGAMEMFTACNQMLREVTGMDPAGVMAQGAGDVPEVTMQRRQIATQTLLAAEFSSLRRYLINEARTMFEYLKMLADDRWIRVAGMNGNTKLLQVVKDPFFLEYDVIIEQGMKDPASRELYWDSFLQIAPTLLRTGNMLPEFLDYAPWPPSLINMLKKAIQQQGEKEIEMQKQGITVTGRGRPISLAEVQAKAAKVQAEAELTKAKAMATMEGIKTERGKLAVEAMRGVADREAKREEGAAQREHQASQQRRQGEQQLIQQMLQHQDALEEQREGMMGETEDESGED